MSLKKASSSATPPSLKDLVQTYSGSGKQFTVKFLGFQDIETAPGKHAAASFAAFKTLRVAMKQTKAHKTRGVLGLTIRELSMYNEQDKSVIKFPMGKVIFVHCDPEDVKVFGVIVRFKNSPGGYRFFAFKADQKITISFVRSAQEVFKTLGTINKVKEKLRKKKESQTHNSSSDAGNADTPELEDEDHPYASIADLNVSECLTRLGPSRPQQEAAGHHYFTIIPPTAPMDQSGADDNNGYASISHRGWVVNWPSELATGSNPSVNDPRQSLWASFENPKGCGEQAKEQADEFIDDEFPIYAVPHKTSLRPVPPSPPPELEEDDDNFDVLDDIPPPVPPQTGLELLDAFDQPLLTAETSKENNSVSSWKHGFTSSQDSASPVYENNLFEVDWSQFSSPDQPNLPARYPDGTASSLRTFPMPLSNSNSTTTSSALDNLPELLDTWPRPVALQSSNMQSEENPYDMVADDPPELLEPDENPYQEVEVLIPLPLSLDTKLETAALQSSSGQKEENPYDMVADDPPKLLEPDENNQVGEAPIPSSSPSVIQCLPKSLHARPGTATLPSSSVQGEEHAYNTVADDLSKQHESAEYSHLRFELPSSPLPSKESGSIYEQVVCNPHEMLRQQQQPGPALPSRHLGRNNLQAFPENISVSKPPLIEQNPSQQSPAVITTADKSHSLAARTRPPPPPPRRGKSSVEAVAAKLKEQRKPVLPRKKPVRPLPYVPLLPRVNETQAPRVNQLPENPHHDGEQKPQSQYETKEVAGQGEQLSSTQVQQHNQNHASQHRLASAEVKQKPVRPPRPKPWLRNSRAAPSPLKSNAGIVEQVQSTAHFQYQPGTFSNEKKFAVASQEKYQSSESTLLDVNPSLPPPELPLPELCLVDEMSTVSHPSGPITSTSPSLEFPNASNELSPNSIPPLSSEIFDESISASLPGLLAEPLPEFDPNTFSLQLPCFSIDSFPESPPEIPPSDIESTTLIPILPPSLPELSLPVDLLSLQDSITKEPQSLQSSAEHKSDVESADVVSLQTEAVGFLGGADGSTKQEVMPLSLGRNGPHKESQKGVMTLQADSQHSSCNSITASSVTAPKVSPRPSSASTPAATQECVLDNKKGALVEEIDGDHGDSMKVSQSEGDLTLSRVSKSVSSQSLRSSSTKKEERQWATTGRRNTAAQVVNKQKDLKRKNRVKSLKSFKQYSLREDMEVLFTVEMIEAHLKTKDHLPVSRGERLSVLLAEHPKLPMGKYIAEKEDGLIGYINEGITWVVDGESGDSSFDDSFDEDSGIPDSMVAEPSINKQSLVTCSPGKHSVPKRPAPPPPGKRQTCSVPTELFSEPETTVTLASSFAPDSADDACTLLPQLPPPPPPPPLPSLPAPFLSSPPQS